MSTTPDSAASPATEWAPRDLDPAYHNQDRLAAIDRERAEKENSATKLKRNISRFFFILIAVGVIALTVVVSRIANPNVLTHTSEATGFWLPNQAEDFKNTITSAISQAEEQVYVLSSSLDNRVLAEALVATAQRGVRVAIIACAKDEPPDQTKHNGQLKQHFEANGIPYLIDNRAAFAPSTITIDNRWGIVSSAPFNSTFFETTNIVHLLSKPEIEQADRTFTAKTEWSD